MNESSVGTSSAASPVSKTQQAQRQEVQEAVIEAAPTEPTIFSFKVLQHKYMDSKRIGGGSQLFSRVPSNAPGETGVSSRFAVEVTVLRAITLEFVFVRE
jgi:hypothetical protein